MVVPDSNLIAEIILFAEGFGNTKVGASGLHRAWWDCVGTLTTIECCLLELCLIPGTVIG